MNTPSVRLGDRKNAKHLYNVEVEGQTPHSSFTIEVDANNSSQAYTIASKAGYIVRSVNMVG